MTTRKLSTEPNEVIAPAVLSLDTFLHRMNASIKKDLKLHYEYLASQSDLLIGQVTFISC